MTASTLVLLPGAGMGAWVWERVSQNLESPSLALDVPCRYAGATPPECSGRLVDTIDAADAGDVVLVMHSVAGVLAPSMADRLGDRLKACVYVAAVIPPAGRTFLDAIKPMNRLALRVLFKLNPAGLKPSESMIRSELCSDLSDEDADRVVSRYEPEFPGLYVTPVGAPVAGPSTYVRLSEDLSLPPDVQDSMIGRLDAPSVAEITSGHLAMLSHPAELARILERAASPTPE